MAEGSGSAFATPGIVASFAPLMSHCGLPLAGSSARPSAPVVGVASWRDRGLPSRSPRVAAATKLDGRLA